MTVKINALKLSLTHIFYGIEQIMDMDTSLVGQLSKIDDTLDELSLHRAIYNLDLWHIKVDSIGCSESWNPFEEKLELFMKRHQNLTAYMYSEKQYKDTQIVDYINKSGQI